MVEPVIARDNIGQFLRYFLVGGIAAIVDISSFMLFVKGMHIDYRLAAVFSFTAGTLTNYMLANAFVFDRGRLAFLEAGVRHYFSSLGGLAVNEAVLILLIGSFELQPLLAKLVATGAAFGANFVMIKFFAFNDRIVLFRKGK